MKKNKPLKKKITGVTAKPSNKGSNRLIKVLLVLIAIAATFFSYTPIKKNALTNWDDDKYITNNPDIRKLDAQHLKLLLTKDYEGNYHPVTMLSLAWNYSKEELNPKAYLYTNLFFHLCNILLVFVFTWKLTVKPAISFIAALLFGIHPLHVESVAWASARKDVLYCFFFLLSLITYLQFLKKSKYILFYLRCSFCFIPALQSYGCTIGRRNCFFRFFLFEKILLAVNLGKDTLLCPGYNFRNYSHSSSASARLYSRKFSMDSHRSPGNSES